jgi:hypothetical protein
MSVLLSNAGHRSRERFPSAKLTPVTSSSTFTVPSPWQTANALFLGRKRASALCASTCARAASILGATLVAERAGDMISELTALLVAGRGLKTLAATIHPYPTQAEVMKKAADAWNRGRLTPRVRRLLAGGLALRR